MNYGDEIKQEFEKSREVVDRVAADGGRAPTTIAELEALSHAVERSLLVLSRQIEEVARMG